MSSLLGNLGPGGVRAKRVFRATPIVSHGIYYTVYHSTGYEYLSMSCTFMVVQEISGCYFVMHLMDGETAMSHRMQIRLYIVVSYPWIYMLQELEIYCHPSTLVGNLHSTVRHELAVLFACISTIECRTFLFIVSSIWIGLHLDLCLVLARDSAWTSYKHLRSALFHWSWARSTSE